MLTQSNDSAQVQEAAMSHCYQMSLDTINTQVLVLINNLSGKWEYCTDAMCSTDCLTHCVSVEQETLDVVLKL